MDKQKVEEEKTILKEGMHYLMIGGNKQSK